jgi:hypothetical protein
MKTNAIAEAVLAEDYSLDAEENLTARIVESVAHFEHDIV